MPIYQAILFAIIQGLTEFLPVSSTAHLAVVHNLGWKFQGPNADTYDFAFDIALHVGTLLAVLIYFFRDWLQIIAQGVGMKYGRDSELARNRGLLWLLAVATIPIGLAGYFLGKQAEAAQTNLFVIGTMLIVVGALMWIGDGLGSRSKGIDRISATDATVIGVAQALAIVPGTSRSGITITAGLFRNLNRETAARFSFLLSTPAIAAAALKKLHDLSKLPGGFPHEMRVPFLVGMVVSAVVGIVVIGFLLNYLRRHSLRFFVWYRIVFGIIVIALAFGYRSGFLR